ncbi:MAG: endonuclease domain-containing protein [Clostridiales bacterium]|nr:endonuclease domain-containing protein [Clostridiales bacterium]
MSLPYNRDLIPRARELRKDATKEERRLWFVFLRAYPIRFQRQKTIGSFIVDFYCYQAKLVIELDGSQHYTEQGTDYDLERDAVLAAYGLQVLRFSNSDVAEHFEAVCETIHRTVQSRLEKVK